MFIGRKKELDFLNSRYKSTGAQLIVMYGRRRVGKTETLSEFCKDKPNVFFSCRECTDNLQLENFSKAILTLDIPAKNYVNTFSGWDDAFSSFAEIKSDNKTVIVIDEFPYMCKGNMSIPSVLQNIWDRVLKTSDIMIILSGSSIGFIEDELLGSKNPLYGRATGIYKMEAMPFDDAVKFFPDYSAEEKIIAYSVLGGIPHYLKQFDPNMSLSENIKDRILTKGAVLYDEVEFLLHQELRETSVYNGIIEAIALGNTAYNDIKLKTGLEKTKLSVYIKNLINLGIVKREFPVTAKINEKVNANNGLYELNDNYFRFWYAFVYKNYSLLEDGEAERVYSKKIEPMLHNFASKAFEDISVFYMKKLRKDDNLPFYFDSIGRWWGKVTYTDKNNGKISVSEEIDILALNDECNNYIIGECKFRNEPFDTAQLKKLKKKADFKGNKYYYLFSLSGFTQSVKSEAENDESIHLISAEEICNFKLRSEFNE